MLFNLYKKLLKLFQKKDSVKKKNQKVIRRLKEINRELDLRNEGKKAGI